MGWCIDHDGRRCLENDKSDEQTRAERWIAPSFDELTEMWIIRIRIPARYPSTDAVPSPAGVVR